MTITGYTYQTLQDECLTHQFSDARYRPLVKVWLNEAQRYVCLQTELRVEESRQTFATVASTATLTIPADFARLIDLSNTDDKNLLNPLELRDYDELTSATGKPTSYTVAASSISLYPTPDAVYNLALRYWRLPADMVADSDTPEIPVQYQHILIRYAMKRAFERENDLEESQYYGTQLTADLMKMRGEVNRDFYDAPSQIPGMWADLDAVNTSVWR